jgi:hypothetical protein
MTRMLKYNFCCKFAFNSGGVGWQQHSQRAPAFDSVMNNGISDAIDRGI